MKGGPVLSVSLWLPVFLWCCSGVQWMYIQLHNPSCSTTLRRDNALCVCVCQSPGSSTAAETSLPNPGVLLTAQTGERAAHSRICLQCTHADNGPCVHKSTRDVNFITCPSLQGSGQTVCVSACGLNKLNTPAEHAPGEKAGSSSPAP